MYFQQVLKPKIVRLAPPHMFDAKLLNWMDMW